MGTVCLWATSATATPSWIARLKTSPVELCVTLLTSAKLSAAEADPLAIDLSLEDLTNRVSGKSSREALKITSQAKHVRMLEFVGQDEIDTFRDQIEDDIKALRQKLASELETPKLTGLRLLYPWVRFGSKYSGVASFVMLPIQLALIYARPPITPELIKFQAAVVIFGVLGVYDCFIRRHDIFRFRHLSLIRWLNNHSSRLGPEVHHWSTSLDVPRQMAHQLLHGDRVSLPDTVRENFRRWVPGIFRLLLRESAQPKTYPLERLRIDMWMVHDEAKPPRLRVYFHKN